ncbi:ABC transporter permease [Celeribacter indicus]|uniref:Peptide/opine ABC transporter inner membrane protein n=1 Tax=Celeribacter indicus TaxID=1208324 RepID=A0A0B5DYD8_9RHOB|nr:ABC transporter permease [Celeribacter indicus]AJE48468.1 peptide/opine ABC transporter inner membrane protein [Celeribacter indicus]SDX28647.1 peptide/nickel transport system permease protein [Celeribacter indicus]
MSDLSVGAETVSSRRVDGSPLGATFRRLLANRVGAFALLFIAALVLAAIFAPLIAPFDPIAINPRERMQAPGWQHLLGTDQLGRDVLSRIIYGTRTALRVALSGTGAALVVGMGLGMISGLAPRWLDSCLVLVGDSLKALPLVLFALALVSIYGPSMTILIVVITISMAPGYFRVVRNQVLVLRNADYIIAAQAMGSSRLRLGLTHLLPNIIGPILVLIAMDIPAVIGIESGLSFLGQGVQPPQASWGTMLSEGYAYLRQAPHIALAAGVPIILTTVAFTFFGEALRDVLDPRTNGGRK